MSGYIGMNLMDVIEQIGEEATKSLLSDFSCPLNKDVEYFLRNTAIEFSKQGISSTFLIMASYKKNYVLVGYYTLANKVFVMTKGSVPSNTWKKRLSKFCNYDSKIKRYILPVPLIGQLGKNYTNSYNELISGDELLKLALDKVKELQMIVGGRIVYLECEDIDVLVDFYSSNGFVNFGKRTLESDEKDKLSGQYLVQMLKYIK